GHASVHDLVSVPPANVLVAGGTPGSRRLGTLSRDSVRPSVHASASRRDRDHRSGARAALGPSATFLRLPLVVPVDRGGGLCRLLFLGRGGGHVSFDER